MRADLKAFAEAYLETFNQAEAYARTHPKASRATCWSSGERVMRNDEVREYIEARLSDQVMSANEVLSRLSMMARGELTPFLKFEGGHVYLDLNNPSAQQYLHLVKTVKMSNRILRSTTTALGGKVQKGKPQATANVTEDLLQQWVEIQLHDPQAALVFIGKHHKLFTDKFEHDVDLHIDGFDELMERVYGK